MDNNRIKKAYGYLDTDKGADEKILAAVKEKAPPAKKRVFLKRGFAAVLAVGLAVGIAVQIPEVSVYAKKVAGTFQNIFQLENGEEIKMEGSFVEVNSNACKKDKKFDSLAEIEEELNLSILKSDMAAERPYSWSYHPATLDDGSFFEITLTNRFYIMGDLKEWETDTVRNPVTGNQCRYQKGEKFKTPINMQIFIKVENDPEIVKGVSSDYEGDSRAFTEGEISETYQSKNLETEVLMYRAPSDGLVVWGDNDITEMTFAQFIYKDIEYHLAGDVSYDTMKEIIEGLYL